ncbi:hypothetical protein CLAIMM_03141 [Cladophialophora immunda]|nr:hypothetical protein CLAIMM_03141 [Cladophialophora immunda]
MPPASSGPQVHRQHPRRPQGNPFGLQILQEARHKGFVVVQQLKSAGHQIRESRPEARRWWLADLGHIQTLP